MRGDACAMCAQASTSPALSTSPVQVLRPVRSAGRGHTRRAQVSEYWDRYSRRSRISPQSLETLPCAPPASALLNYGIQADCAGASESLPSLRKPVWAPKTPFYKGFSEQREGPGCASAFAGSASAWHAVRIMGSAAHAHRAALEGEKATSAAPPRRKLSNGCAPGRRAS